jgi:hypothetical protein
MSANLPETALVLVAILPSPQDLEIARVLGWYRIPLRKAPKVVDVDYLAFYQTAAFGEAERWQIEYVAPVRGHELTTRADLLRGEPDHPHANEEYYKIQIGPLARLSQPIQAGSWRRITFLYTTGEYLCRASKIGDLVVHSEEREVLWSSLRERAVQAGSYHAGDLPELSLDANIVELFGLLSAYKNNNSPQSTRRPQRRTREKKR